MTLDDLLHKCDELIARGVFSRLRVGSGGHLVSDEETVNTAAELEQLERVAGFRIPADYKTFLQRYPRAFIVKGANFVVPGVIMSPTGADDIDFAMFTGLGLEMGALNVVDLTEAWNTGRVFAARELPGYIVIGESNDGHPYVLGPSESGPVSYFDSAGAGGSHDPASLFCHRVANDFTEFLGQLIAQADLDRDARLRVSRSRQAGM